MVYRTRFCLLLGLACFLAAFTTHAQRQLQDTFTLERAWTTGLNLVDDYSRFYGIAVDYSNRCYVANGSGVSVYGTNGVIVTNWSIPSARGVSFDRTSNLVFVCAATANNQIRIYDSNLSFIRQWGTNSLSGPSAVAVGPNNLVYVADSGNSRIQVYDRMGNYSNQWAVGSASNVSDVSAAADGSIYAAAFWSSTVYRYDSNGTVLGSLNTSPPSWVRSAPSSVDGLIFAVRYQSLPYLLSAQLSYLYTVSPNASGTILSASFAPDGQRVYVLAQNQVIVLRRLYRTAGLKPLNALPLPAILNTAQRSGTQWIDVDFSVADPDNATVQLGAIAFVNGNQNLLDAVPMLTFTNGTDIVSLTNVTTGVSHHLTWNAGADWSGRYGNLRVNILAQDNRNLIDFHLITIPDNATYSNALTISVSPYGQTDFLGVWTWLIASGNPNVNLVTGSVFSVGSLYGVSNNTLLAQTQIASGVTNTMTTTSGLTFLCTMMSSNLASTAYSNLVLRTATTNEIYRAAMGTTHTNLTVITKWQPLAQINGLPGAVNEYGFDTGSIGAGGTLPNNMWWVVLAPPGQ